MKEGKRPKENNRRALLMKDKAIETSLVQYSWPIEIHKKLKCWEHQRDGLFHILNQLVQIQKMRRVSGDVLLLCHRSEYLSLVKDIIYNNIRAGGFLPYHCFVTLILELIFCRKKYLVECLDRLEKDVAGCPQSQNLLNTLRSYIKILRRCFSIEGKVLADEMSLFLVTASLFNDTKKLGEQLLNKYRVATKQGVRCRKLITGDIDIEKIPGTFDHIVWSDKSFTIVARLSVTIWASSLCLRLKEIDLALDLLEDIPRQAGDYKIVREVKSVAFAEKGREVFKTDGATDEVYELLLQSLSTCYSWDVIVDIGNCLVKNYRVDIYDLFRPSGKFYDLLDLHGKVCIIDRLPLDERISQLEGLIDESIREKSSRVVESLVRAYLKKGLVDKTENFIKRMEKIEWDFKKSGETDHIQHARFQLALKRNDYKNAIILGERFISTYERKRTTFLGYFYQDIAQACFKLGKNDLAQKYCNKGLMYDGSHNGLWKVKKQILEKEKTT